MLYVYSKENCAQCRTAMAMLKSKGVEFEVLKLEAGDFTREDLKMLAPEAKSFPQVFDNSKLIGGVPELQQYLKNI